MIYIILQWTVLILSLQGYEEREKELCHLGIERLFQLLHVQILFGVDVVVREVHLQSIYSQPVWKI